MVCDSSLSLTASTPRVLTYYKLNTVSHVGWGCNFALQFLMLPVGLATPLLPSAQAFFRMEKI